MSIFKIDNQHIIDLVNTKYPVKLRNNEELINRVYNRCPFIKKYEVAIIIKLFFETIRELLLSEKIISVLPIFTNTQIKTYPNYANKDAMNIRIRTNTNKKLK